ncbi:UNVERIFIED_CONTAM: hypothetical protein HDU68_007811 [Siphonaria sp. JEL0065]|nr:hypothetical protein HDU68_007811 [Siphonaria sp. JEL0065]
MSSSDSDNLFDLSKRNNSKKPPLPKRTPSKVHKSKFSKLAQPIKLLSKRSFLFDSDSDSEDAKKRDIDKMDANNKRLKPNDDVCIILSDDDDVLNDGKAKEKDNELRLKLEQEREKLRQLKERKAAEALVSSSPPKPTSLSNANKHSQDENEAASILTEDPITLTVLIWQRENPEKATKVKFKIAPIHSFKLVMDNVCERLGVAGLQDMVFKFKNVELLPLSTPKTMGSYQAGQSLKIDAFRRDYYNQLQAAKTLELERTYSQMNEAVGGGDHISAGDDDVHAAEPPPTPLTAAADTNILHIKVRDRSQTTHELKVKPTTKISAIIDAFAKLVDKPASSIRLEFDHEILDPSSTIEECEIEDDDLIDVK